MTCVRCTRQSAWRATGSKAEVSHSYLLNGDLGNMKGLQICRGLKVEVSHSLSALNHHTQFVYFHPWVTWSGSPFVYTLCVFLGSLFTHSMKDLEFLAMCCAQVTDGAIQTQKMSKLTTVIDRQPSSRKKQRSSSLQGGSGSNGTKQACSRKGLRSNDAERNVTDTRTQDMATSRSDPEQKSMIHIKCAHQPHSIPATMGKSTDLWNRFLGMTHRMDRLQETMRTLISKVAERDNVIQRSDTVTESIPSKNDQVDLLMCVLGGMEQRLFNVEQSNVITLFDQRGNLTTPSIETHLSITKMMIDYSVASQSESMNTRLATLSNNWLLIQNRIGMIYAQAGSYMLMSLEARTLRR